MPQKIATTLRLPPDVKAYLEEEARHNMSSQNSEIVRALRAQMRAKAARNRTTASHAAQPAEYRA